MAGTLDLGYLFTIPGILNLAEIASLIAALISVGFTSRLYCELADNLQAIYPELNTLTVRSVFQAFSTICLFLTIIIFLAHLFGIRYFGKRFYYFNQLCLALNILMGLMMISIGICAALWEDKLRRTPGVIKRGYLRYDYQVLFNEPTHPRPGAAAAAATFALLAGILFFIEACTRPFLSTGATRLPTYTTDRPSYTISPATQKSLLNTNVHHGERIIPIETTSPNQPYRV